MNKTIIVVLTASLIACDGHQLKKDAIAEKKTEENEKRHIFIIPQNLQVSQWKKWPIPANPFLPQTKRFFGADGKNKLEKFSIKVLKLVGTIERNGRYWGLVLCPDGQVHSVQKGDKIGRKNGRVIVLTGSYLSIKEKTGQQGARNNYIKMRLHRYE